MALVNLPEVRRSSPPPVPVKLRLEAEPFSRLTRELVYDLRERLTNVPARGDFSDDGDYTGSYFRDQIDEWDLGIATCESHWVVTVWPESSQWRGPVAWCLLWPSGRIGFSDNKFLRFGAYTAPEWRKRGIGRLLVNESLRVSRHMGDFLSLRASPWNARSLGFFKGLGFDAKMGWAEMPIPAEPPERLPWRCRPPVEP